MKRIVIRILVLAAMLCASGAQAAITCTISSLGWGTAYSPSAPGTNVTQSTFSITCQRNVAGDPTTLNYTVGVDNGTHFVGQANKAQFGTNTIGYENYKDSACTLLWKGAGGNRISGSMTLSGLTQTTVTTSYWGCVPAAQAGLPTGTYTDLVTMTLANSAGGATLATNTFGVSIYNPAVCNITQAPGNVAFTYTAFRATAATASTTFGVTCTNTLGYTLALDAPSGVVTGLQYLVSLSASTASGTGLQQTFTVNGTMPAGQAGTCATASCTGTDTRTLTITY